MQGVLFPPASVPAEAVLSQVVSRLEVLSRQLSLIHALLYRFHFMLSPGLALHRSLLAAAFHRAEH